MSYRLAPIGCRPWLLNGMSLKLIESHYENNYGGALRRLNAIDAQLKTLDLASTPAFVLNGLKREELVALNSTFLHELYFASLGFGEGLKPGPLAEAIERDFGSFARWQAEFVAMSQALAGGSGWVVLTWMPRDGRLINQYASEHSQAVAGGVPILAIDMYEHAYHIDFGANARAYIEAFRRNIDWPRVAERFDDAQRAPAPRPVSQPEYDDLPAVAVEEVRSQLAKGESVQLIDARPSFYAMRSTDIAQGAVWKDPEKVKEWAAELKRDEPVVVYCAYGFHIGCKTAGALKDAGFDVRWMKGGHSAWRAIGAPVKLNA